LEDIGEIVQARNAEGAQVSASSQHLPENDAPTFTPRVGMLFHTLARPDHWWPNNDKSGGHGEIQAIVVIFARSRSQVDV
jgi:hypothetical protein